MLSSLPNDQSVASGSSSADANDQVHSIQDEPLACKEKDAATTDGDKSTPNPPPDSQPPPTQFKFSIKRFLMAVAVFAAVVAISERVGEYRYVPIFMVGLPLAVITLIATKRDIPRILLTYFLAGFYVAAIVCMLAAPPGILGFCIICAIIMACLVVMDISLRNKSRPAGRRR